MPGGLKFQILIEDWDCIIHETKTKVLISCAVTVQLICVFVFAYAKSWVSHNEAHIIVVKILEKLQNLFFLVIIF